MISYIFALFLFVGSALALPPQQDDLSRPLWPGTFVIGVLPSGLDPACKQGQNKQPFFVAPSLPGRVEVGSTRVFSADPTKGGKLHTAVYNNDLVSVIPPARVTETDPRTGAVTSTEPVWFWYCMDVEAQPFGGELFSSSQQTVALDNQIRHTGTFLKLTERTCAGWVTKISETGTKTLVFNDTFCK